ncbi:MULTISPECIES: hypothetical protein [Paraburkholderia]|uniref:Uncharacterized protein n=3 Tax=Paraburkholderia TaxID=1822464 RepID=A0A7Z7B9I2_9BURK|nr:MULTISPECIES: hypothetical protein [Paraburkholderia]AUT65832.1 hypothetical protein C2L65_40825 [Paraburkholderia terrae]TCG07830.1 hypothetical protein BZM27_16305 [Paraburkholderia steynii]SDI28426.1 hypothetical protein SAMN04487926_114180 [Paraburkholderia steynii]BCZ83140.1 hypothetical protein PTKU64_68150 [Paraburkholderia terrae]BDC43534.1 hypothetical protein PTKU15_68310 [Paraburkholderia terrae]
MNTRIILSAACTVALSLTSVAHAQGTPAQQNAQPAPTTSTPGTTEYGGVSGTTMAMGNAAHPAWTLPASCGHMARCNPNSGH